MTNQKDNKEISINWIFKKSQFPIFPLDFISASFAWVI